MSTVEELKKLLEEKEQALMEIKNKYEPPRKKLGRPRGTGQGQIYTYVHVRDCDRKKAGRKCLPIAESDMLAFKEGRLNDISSQAVYRTLKYRSRYTRKNR